VDEMWWGCGGNVDGTSLAAAESPVSGETRDFAVCRNPRQHAT
jgi:hypothetical protein